MVRNLLQYISDLHFLFILADFGFELQFSKKYIYIIVRAITTFLYIHSIHKKWLWNIILTKISAWNLGLLLQILCLYRAPVLQHYNLQLIIVNWILQLRIWIGLFWSAEGSIAPSRHFVNLADLCKLKGKYENRTTATYKLKCFWKDEVFYYVWRRQIC